jgi:hypothetical protein
VNSSEMAASRIDGWVGGMNFRPRRLGRRNELQTADTDDDDEERRAAVCEALNVVRVLLGEVAGHVQTETLGGEDTVALPAVGGANVLDFRNDHRTELLFDRVEILLGVGGGDALDLLARDLVTGLFVDAGDRMIDLTLDLVGDVSDGAGHHRGDDNRHDESEEDREDAEGHPRLHLDRILTKLLCLNHPVAPTFLVAIFLARAILVGHVEDVLLALLQRNDRRILVLPGFELRRREQTDHRRLEHRRDDKGLEHIRRGSDDCQEEQNLDGIALILLVVAHTALILR